MSAVRPGLPDAARHLAEDGYCHVPGVLDQALLEAVRTLASDALAAATPAHRAAYRSEGSLVPVADFPAFSALIAAPSLGKMRLITSVLFCRRSTRKRCGFRGCTLKLNDTSASGLGRA